MIRIDYLLFGYRKVTIDEADKRMLADILLKKNFSIKFEGCSFFISERSFQRLKIYLDGKIDYTSGELFGLWGLIKKSRKRYGLFLALTLSIIMTLFANSVVWDIRIEGTDAECHEAILSELDSVGLSVGRFWHKIDKSEIEAHMLDDSEYVSWLNINRRGTVAYVKVMDKISHGDESQDEGYANIVAERDCVIEEITVKSGVPLVKAGETVKAGQILISGVIPESMGGGFCHAEGTVRGRYTSTLDVSVPETELVKTASDKKIKKISLIFFGKEINIFKIYRNSQDECAIIRDKRDIRLPGGKKLPLGTVKTYELSYTLEERSLTEDEMIARAGVQMRERLRTELLGKELLRIKTSAEMAEGEYTMRTDYVCLSEIGKELKFEVNLD